MMINNSKVTGKIFKKENIKFISYPHILLIIIIIGVFRIHNYQEQISNTADEINHYHTALEWWQYKSNDTAENHVPFAKIIGGSLPYFMGFRTHYFKNNCKETFVEFANRVLLQNDNYSVYCIEKKNLSLMFKEEFAKGLGLARKMMILFFIVACIYLFLLIKEIFNEQIALISVIIFTIIPTNLAHASILGTDFPLMSLSIIYLYYAISWYKELNLKNTLLLTLFASLLLLTKATGVLIIIASALAIILCYPSRINYLKQYIFHFLLLLFISFFIIWAVYFFSLGKPIENIIFIADFFDDPENIKNYKLLYYLANANILPFYEYFITIQHVILKNQIGHSLYLMGETQQNGNFWYFPLIIFFKTPLIMLALIPLGIGYLFYNYKLGKAYFPLLLFAILMIPLLLSNINIGVRHAIYQFIFISVFISLG